MFEAAQQVEAQLLAGEDARSAFKALRSRTPGVQAPNAESVAGEVVAFADADGGALFPRCAAMLGVNDHSPFGTRRAVSAPVDIVCGLWNCSRGMGGRLMSGSKPWITKTT